MYETIGQNCDEKEYRFDLKLSMKALVCLDCNKLCNILLMKVQRTKWLYLDGCIFQLLPGYSPYSILSLTPPNIFLRVSLSQISIFLFVYFQVSYP